MDKKLIGSYKFVFRGGDGQVVLDDLREQAGINEPFGADLTEGQMRQKAAFNDFFRYIENMIEVETPKPQPKEQ